MFGMRIPETLNLWTDADNRTHKKNKKNTVLDRADSVRIYSTSIFAILPHFAMAFAVGWRPWPWRHPLGREMTDNFMNRQEQTYLQWLEDRNRHICKTLLQILWVIGIFRIWWAMGQCRVCTCSMFVSLKINFRSIYLQLVKGQGVSINYPTGFSLLANIYWTTGFFQIPQAFPFTSQNVDRIWKVVCPSAFASEWIFLNQDITYLKAKGLQFLQKLSCQKAFRDQARL